MGEDIYSRLKAVVEGRVQGVSFRMFVFEKAQGLGLTGWVRNLYTGDVEVCAEGKRQDLDKLLSYLRRGPRSAYVTGVKYSWEEAINEFTRFEIRSTR
jgi:acylphosphatase